MKYTQKWEDRISGEFVSKYTVFSHKGGVRILAVNPKDLNKDRGLTKMSPLFLFTILIPEIIVHDVSLTFIRVKQVKRSLFHGRWAAEVPKTKAWVLRKLNQTSWVWFKRKNAGNPNEPSEFFVARPFWRVKDCAWSLALIGRWGRHDHVWQFRRIRTHTKCRLPILAIGGYIHIIDNHSVNQVLAHEKTEWLFII